MTKKASLATTAIFASFALVLAGCGSSSSGSGGNGGGSSTQAQKDATAAQQAAAPYLKQPTEIGITMALSKKPPTGKKVYWLQGNIDSIIPITDGFKTATKALGWNLTTLSYDPSNPQAPGGAMMQAIQGGADYIAISGQTISVLGPALDAAKKANIPVIDLYSTDVPGGASNGIYANPGGPDYSKKASEVLTNWVIGDSGGKANVLFVSDPDFQILKVVEAAIQGDFKSKCGSCSFKTLEVSTSDLTAGNTASNVISRLQSDPSIDYVYVAIGDLAAGLPQALASAGLAGKVKIVGGVPNKAQVQSLIDKTANAYTPLGRPESAWATTDVMALLSVGMGADVSEHALLPIWLWTQNNVPKPAQDYTGPVNYEAQFKALWKIS